MSHYSPVCDTPVKRAALVNWWEGVTFLPGRWCSACASASSASRRCWSAGLAKAKQKNWGEIPPLPTRLGRDKTTQGRCLGCQTRLRRLADPLAQVTSTSWLVLPKEPLPKLLGPGTRHFIPRGWPARAYRL
jgi:hypothetical protein